MELREKADKEQEENNKEKDEKVKDKATRRMNFIACKETCSCKDKVCKASGLKQCPVCNEVMKSECSKKKCLINGIKPLMMLCEFDMRTRADRREKAAAKTKKRKLLYDSDKELQNGMEDYEDNLFELMIENDEEEMWNPEVNYVPDESEKENRESCSNKG